MRTLKLVALGIVLVLASACARVGQGRTNTSSGGVNRVPKVAAIEPTTCPGVPGAEVNMATLSHNTQFDSPCYTASANTWVIIKFVITPVIAPSQRRYEYGADAGAARIGYATDLSSALRKISAFEGGRTGWEQAMTATHPPTELRLEALEPPKPDDYEYQEDELRAPTGEEVSRLLTFWHRTPKDQPEG